MRALKDEDQEGVVRESCHGAVNGQHWCALGTVRLEVTEAGQGLEPFVCLLEILADREDEFVDGRGVVMVGKRCALMGEMDEVKTGKLQAFGRKVVTFVAEKVEVFAEQVVPAVRKGPFVKEE